MNSFNSRNPIIIIAVIMIAIATSLFIIIPITPTFLIAYAFTVFAIVMFCGGKLYLLANPNTYPWFAAFPMTIWWYLFVQLAVSAVFLVRENFFEGEFSIRLFLFLHIVLLGLFAIILIMLKGSKEIIVAKDVEVKQKVSTLRLMQSDVELILRNNPEHEEPLRRVLDALKYSDPMSNSALAVYDEQIQRKIIEMNDLHGNDSANISQLCEKLLIQIADRNNRVKLMK